MEEKLQNISIETVLEEMKERSSLYNHHYYHHHNDDNGDDKVTPNQNQKKEKKRKVVFLYHDSKIGEAFSVLGRNNLLSAPVLLDNSIGDDEGGTYMGFVDVISLLHELMRDVKINHQQTQKEKQKQQLEEKQPLSSLEKWQSFKDLSTDFGDRKLITALSKDVAVQYYTSESLYDVITKEFLPRGVHRMAIFNAKGHVIGILSQSDVLAYIYKHHILTPDQFQNTVAEEGLCSSNAICLNGENTSAVEALEIMDEKSLSCIGVVDKHNKLTGTLSVSDLRGLEIKHFPLLLLNINDFIKERDSIIGHRRPSLLTCSSSDTFGSVLAKVIHSGFHRVFIVDKDGCPISLATLTDMLRCIIERDKQTNKNNNNKHENVAKTDADDKVIKKPKVDKDNKANH